MEVAHEILELLKKIPAFDGVDEQGLRELLSLCSEAEYPANTAIVQEGEKGDCVFFIEEGEVEISMSITLKVNPGEEIDRDKVLVHLGPGGMFGEMAFIVDTDLRAATVTSVTPVKLIKLTTTDFSRFAERDLKNAFIIVRNIGKIISGRLKKTNQDVAKLTTVLSVVLSKSSRG